MPGSFFSVLFGVCLPILAVAGIGWVADRRFRFDLGSLVRLNLYVFVPAFVFVRVYGSEVSGGEAGRIVLFTVTLLAAIFALGWAAAWLGKFEPRERHALHLGTMFYNCGNYGIPLVTLAFGTWAQSVQVFALVTVNVSTFSLGLLFAAAGGQKVGSGRWRRWLPVLRQPSIWMIAAGFAARQVPFDLRTVPALWTPLELLADALLGVALVTLGVQLSHTKPPPLRSRLAWALGLRLVVAPLVAFPLTAAFGFDTATSHVLIAGAAAPTAVNTALIAHEFGADSRFAAAVVFYSTLLSAATVTATLVLLGQLAGAG
jgi:predicted permease